MKSNHSLLKLIIRKLIREAYASGIDGPHIDTTISMSNHLSQRDEIPYLGKKQNKDDEEIAAHLMDPEETPEDCYGPVPPNAEEPGVYSDPYTKGWPVIPKADHRR